ncbi:MAG TPA: hypothetical protein VFP14_12110 [Novosphingobium sp.]|nr:hypothetical protein [Novosphingobium sp.]
MDLNELLYQHQRAILHAGRMAPGPGPSSFDLVGHYAGRIRRLRERLGAPGYPEWMAAHPG